MWFSSFPNSISEILPRKFDPVIGVQLAEDVRVVVPVYLFAFSTLSSWPPSVPT